MGVGGVRYSVSEKVENFAHYASSAPAACRRSISLSFLEANKKIAELAREAGHSLRVHYGRKKDVKKVMSQSKIL